MELNKKAKGLKKTYQSIKEASKDLNANNVNNLIHTSLSCDIDSCEEENASLADQYSNLSKLYEEFQRCERKLEKLEDSEHMKESYVLSCGKSNIFDNLESKLEAAENRIDIRKKLKVLKHKMEKRKRNCADNVIIVTSMAELKKLKVLESEDETAGPVKIFEDQGMENLKTKAGGPGKKPKYERLENLENENRVPEENSAHQKTEIISSKTVSSEKGSDYHSIETEDHNQKIEKEVTDQIRECKRKKRSKRCNDCEGCLIKTDCGNCRFCKVRFLVRRKVPEMFMIHFG